MDAETLDHAKTPGGEERTLHKRHAAHGARHGEKAGAATPPLAPTDALVAFTLDTRAETIPDALQARLHELFLDWLGIAAFAATRAESSPPITQAIRRIDTADGSATVVGDPRKYSWLHAALLNGCHAHSLDFDDTNLVQVGHPGAPVIAALLAEAERIDATARDFFAAMAVGYEVACRLGAGLTTDSYDRGFHMTPLAGIFGAVAGVGRLRSFSHEVLSSAFGLALSKAAGSMQYLENGAWNKRLHPGFAAHDALLCAGLAEAGVKGAAKAFEGRFGLLHAYSGKPEVDALTDKLGEEWVAWETAIKPYPSCRLTHGPVDSALKLRGKVADGDRAKAKVEIQLPPAAIPIVGTDTPGKRAPKNTVDGQFSVYFQFAEAWLQGDVTWDSYERLAEPGHLALMKAITVKPNADLLPGGSVVTVQAGGATLGDTVAKPLGEPENWIGADGVRKKFMMLATPIYGEELSHRIADQVLRLGTEGSIHELMTLMRVERQS